MNSGVGRSLRIGVYHFLLYQSHAIRAAEQPHGVDQRNRGNFVEQKAIERRTDLSNPYSCWQLTGNVGQQTNVISIPRLQHRMFQCSGSVDA